MDEHNTSPELEIEAAPDLGSGVVDLQDQSGARIGILSVDLGRVKVVCAGDCD